MNSFANNNYKNAQKDLLKNEVNSLHINLYTDYSSNQNLNVVFYKTLKADAKIILNSKAMKTNKILNNKVRELCLPYINQATVIKSV